MLIEALDAYAVMDDRGYIDPKSVRDQAQTCATYASVHDLVFCGNYRVVRVKITVNPCVIADGDGDITP